MQLQQAMRTMYPSIEIYRGDACLFAGRSLSNTKGTLRKMDERAFAHCYCLLQHTASRTILVGSTRMTTNSILWTSQHMYYVARVISFVCEVSFVINPKQQFRSNLTQTSPKIAGHSNDFKTQP